MPRIEDLERRVHADPTSVAFAALAEEYRRAGRFREAVDTCRAGLMRHPVYVSARVTLGRALLDSGDLDGARAELEAVLTVAPDNLAAIRGLADIHRRLDHLPEALEQYRSALGIARHDPELHEKVEQLSRQLEPRPAESAQAGRSYEATRDAISSAGTGGNEPSEPIPEGPVREPPATLAALEGFLDAVVTARQALGASAGAPDRPMRRRS
jgi:tetratricopeptide (TPR) repeat protein